MNYMSGRQSPLVSGEYYHVFNRGVAKQAIFGTRSDYERAMLTLEYYRFTNPPIKLSKFKDLSLEDKTGIEKQLKHKNDRLVDILGFVLMPNHFHFLLKQNNDGGISKYISQFSNSYTRYYNTRNNRVGPMFQGAFKSVKVESIEQLIHLSRYIHLNPYVSSIVKKTELENYLWSSLPIYLGKTNNVIDLDPVVSQFRGGSSYKDFVFDHADYARELEVVKHLTIDIDG